MSSVLVLQSMICLYFFESCAAQLFLIIFVTTSTYTSQRIKNHNIKKSTIISFCWRDAILRTNCTMDKLGRIPRFFFYNFLLLSFDLFFECKKLAWSYKHRFGRSIQCNCNITYLTKRTCFFYNLVSLRGLLMFMSTYMHIIYNIINHSDTHKHCYHGNNNTMLILIKHLCV